MKLLVLIPLVFGFLADKRRILRVEFHSSQSRSVNLLVDGHGNLAAASTSTCDVQAGQELVGVLHYAPRPLGGTWFFLRCHSAVTLDSLAPPLSVTVLEAGSVLSCGEHSWLVAFLWKALPVHVPDLSQDDLCPVCSGPLSLAPIVYCNCGRAVHLQTAEAGDASADDVLDCFLKAGPCECGIEATRAAQLLPQRATCVLKDLS